MVFGYWAIITAVTCVVGFTYMTVAGFSDVLDDSAEGKDTSSSENTES